MEEKNLVKDRLIPKNENIDTEWVMHNFFILN